MNTCIALGCLKACLKWSAGWCTSNVFQKGKTALIAGATKRPGYQIAANLAHRGCRIIIADRDNLHNTRDKLISETGNNLIEFKHVDFYKLNSVRSLAQDLKRTEEKLHLLIYADNVSGMGETLTDDGFHKVLQYNNLAPFLLTHELQDLMKKTANSKIIFRSNILAFFHKISSPDDINRTPETTIKLVNDFQEYCNSSALTLMTMSCFAENLKEHRVCCCAAHPGFMDMSVCDNSKSIDWNKVDDLVFNNIIPSFLRLFAKTDKEAAQTAIHAAVCSEDRELVGKFLADCKVIMQPPSVQVHLFRMKIFEEMKRLVLQEKVKAEAKTISVPAPNLASGSPAARVFVVPEAVVADMAQQNAANKIPPVIPPTPVVHVQEPIVTASETILSSPEQRTVASEVPQGTPAPSVTPDGFAEGGGQAYVAPSIIQKSTTSTSEGAIDATPLMSEAAEPLKPFDEDLPKKN